MKKILIVIGKIIRLGHKKTEEPIEFTAERSLYERERENEQEEE